MKNYSLRIVSAFALLVLGCIAGIFIYRSFSSYCRGLVGTATVSTVDSASVSKGYLLVAPNYADNFFNEPGKVQLIDTNGVVVHEWKTEYTPMYAVLEPDGSIFVEMTTPANIVATPGGGKTGLIQHLAWNSKVLWEYDDENMNHDFEPLPEGSVAFLDWVAMPSAEAAKVVGGLRSSLATSSTVWADAIVVVNQDKQITWQWNLADHLDPSQYPLNSFTPYTDWSHSNSIRYTDNNPITHTPAFLISVRHISRVLLVDAHSGNIIWMSPAGMTSFQHDATLLDNGDILVFDNGLYRPQDRPYLWSRVVEINPLTDQIVWQNKGGKTGTENAQFASSIMGGAQRLANGNTLITFSTQNRVVEVNSQGTIVWDYTNRFTDAQGRQYILFKTRKYDPEGTEWGVYLKQNLNLKNFCPR